MLVVLALVVGVSDRALLKRDYSRSTENDGLAMVHVSRILVDEDLVGRRWRMKR